MMYHFAVLEDETEIVHSHLITDNGEYKVIVHFERPTEDGFDFARCILPEKRWTEVQGYLEKEIRCFEEFLKINMQCIFKKAQGV